MYSRCNCHDQFLGNFPKKRPELPREYQLIYEAEYLNNRNGYGLVSAFASALESWMHRKAASHHELGDSVLELGAGTLNHLEFEPNVGAYDIVEPFHQLYDGRESHSKIRSSYQTIHDVPESNRYARILSVAVLEHVLDLPALVARSGLLLAEKGVFSAGVPTEGGLLWYLAWRLGTGIPFYIKYRMDYAPYMRFEHVNSAYEIESVLRFFFGHVTVERYPFDCFHSSFYSYFDCHEPRLNRCADYLKEMHVNKNT